MFYVAYGSSKLRTILTYGKATTVILWLPNYGVNPVTTIVRETGIHQLHVWNKPHVKCGAGLANDVA